MQVNNGRVENSGHSRNGDVAWGKMRRVPFDLRRPRPASSGRLPFLVTETPAYDRRAEVERLLAADQTVLGRVWRYEQEGMTPQQMTEAESVATGWVSNYRTLIRVLRDGEIPTSPSTAHAGGRRVRSWIRKPELSAELRRDLIRQEQLLTSRAEDKDAQEAEFSDAVEKSVTAEASGTPGIYVYTLPHYLLHPYDPISGRTPVEGRALRPRRVLPRQLPGPTYRAPRGPDPSAHLPRRGLRGG